MDGKGPIRHTRAADVELLARLLSGRSAERLARAAQLVGAAGSVWGLRALDVRRIRELGLGRDEAARLAAAFEIGKRCIGPAPPPRIFGPLEAYACVAGQFAGARRERFVVVALDVKNRPRAVSVIAEGWVDACPVDPREVFRTALLETATSVLLAHNHPSGDPEPSADDLVLTERLAAAGEILGITVLDHVIVGQLREEPGDGDYVSLVAAGLWPGRRPANHAVGRYRAAESRPGARQRHRKNFRAPTIPQLSARSTDRR